MRATLTFGVSNLCDHEFDMFDYDSGDNAEYGHCSKCGCWIDTFTGENETERFEREQAERFD